MIPTDPAFVVAASAAAGLALGRPLSALVVRLPAAMERHWKSLEGETPDPQAHRAPAPFSPPNRFSPVQAARDTRPVLAALALAPACALPALGLGPGWALAPALAASFVLMALAAIDWTHRLLPDLLVLPLLGAGLLVNLGGLFAPWGDAVAGAALGYGGLWALSSLYRLLAGHPGIGAGDVKLLAALGAWLGWKALLPLALLAAFLAILSCLAAALSRGPGKAAALQPYGACLALVGWGMLALPPGQRADPLAAIRGFM